jgi:hypothetical protein
VENYVEEELGTQIGPLIKFVRDAEAHASSSSSSSSSGGGGTQSSIGGIGPGSKEVAKSLVDGFSSGWKQSVETINVDVMGSFNNMKNGASFCPTPSRFHL